MSKIPSIAMIPSAFKSGKVYSVLPSDGSGDLNFARASEATRVNENGFIETVGSNVPRIDYTDGGCPKLLLEPQSTNFITHSEDFSNASWTAFDVSKEPNTIVSPSGALNGCRLTALSGNNKVFQNLISVVADPTNNRTYNGSLYIKSPNTTTCQLRVGTSSSNTNINITSEWQRFDANYVLDATFTAVRLGVVLFNDGDIVDVAFGQIEELPYATSYIPTNGGTVTREAETASKSGLSSYINSQEGVLYAEISALADDGTNRFLSINDGSNDNEVRFYFESTSNTIGFNVRANSSDILTSTNYVVSNAEDFAKMAIVYKSGRNEFYVNGLKVYDSSDTFTFSSDLTDIKFSRGSDGNPFYGKTKALKVYNQALTDLELEEMTGFKSFVQMANQLNYTVI